MNLKWKSTKGVMIKDDVMYAVIKEQEVIRKNEEKILNIKKARRLH